MPLSGRVRNLWNPWNAIPTLNFEPYGKSWKSDLERMGGKDGIKDPRFIIEHAGDPEYSLLTRSSDARTPGANYETFRKAVEHDDPAIAANAILGLIKITTYLLDQQIRQLEKAFVEEGGLRERMTRARLNERARQSATKPGGSFRNHKR